MNGNDKYGSGEGTYAHEISVYVARIAQLERAVIEAAVERRLTERDMFPLGAPDSGSNSLNAQFIAEQQAVDALLQARKEPKQ